MQQTSSRDARDGCEAMRGSRWAFYGVCVRGTASSMYDYADFAERLCGAKTVAIICGFSADASYATSIARFRARFPVVLEPKHVKRALIDSNFSFHKALEDVSATHFYAQISGIPLKDRMLRPRFDNLPALLALHFVFDARLRWGDSFAKISHGVRGRTPIVGHIAKPLPKVQGNLREALRIPAGATVFCSYGGGFTFDLLFVRRTVCELARSSELANRTSFQQPLWFLFANHVRFCDSTAHPRAIFLPNRRNETEKAMFVNTCDAMLHARASGETFGLAVAEFSLANKPVFVWRPHNDVMHAPVPKHLVACSDHEAAGCGGVRTDTHLVSLGSKGLQYSEETLATMLQSFDRVGAAHRDWRGYADYSAAKVMRNFSRYLFTTTKATKSKNKRVRQRGDAQTPPPPPPLMSS